jgi:hypothetical protein
MSSRKYVSPAIICWPETGENMSAQKKKFRGRCPQTPARGAPPPCTPLCAQRRRSNTTTHANKYNTYPTIGGLRKLTTEFSLLTGLPLCHIISMLQSPPMCHIYSHFGIHAVSWMPLSLLVVSSPLSVFFIIGCYSEGLFHIPLAFGTCEIHTGSLVCEHVLRPISTKS